MLLFAEERLPAIPSGDHHDEDDDGVDDNHEDEDDDGVDDDQYGDGDLHSHLITSDDRSNNVCKKVQHGYIKMTIAKKLAQYVYR